jgi:hypothetical protein
MLLGYSAPRELHLNIEAEHRECLESFGLRNQATFYIWERLSKIRDVDGSITEGRMEAFLRKVDQDLRATVVHLREYDRTGQELVELLNRATPIAAEFLERENATADIIRICDIG